MKKKEVFTRKKPSLPLLLLSEYSDLYREDTENPRTEKRRYFEKKIPEIFGRRVDFKRKKCYNIVSFGRTFSEKVRIYPKKQKKPLTKYDPKLENKRNDS